MPTNRPHSVTDARPTSVRHLIGQRGVVAQVEVGLDAAHSDGRKFDDSLLTGPPGLGKSQVASVIAAEMAGGFHEVLGQAISSIGELNALLLRARDRDVVHVDECHELSTTLMTTLYQVLDQRRVHVGGKNAMHSIPLSDFTLLLSTTDEHRLLQPLRDRMKLTLRFDFYTDDELVRLLDARVRSIQWQVDDEVLRDISVRSRGTPRLALRLLQSCYRCARASGDFAIRIEHLHQACRLESLDDRGCGPTEQKYLAALVDGACRLNVVTSMLGLPTRTVTEVIEPYLIRVGLVTKDDQGRRALTATGREHVLSRLADDSSREVRS